MSHGKPALLFKKVDCIRLFVKDLDAGLGFYRDQLGHDLIWRSDTAAGLRLPESEAELVLQTERPGLEVDFLVPSADEAAARFEAAGGRIIEPPFDIPIGRCAVVTDPWGNELVILDGRKGSFITDENGRVIGVS